MGDVDGRELFRRYHWLVDQLADEYGRARGWRRRVARMLGVHESYVSKIDREMVDTVGADAVDKAVQNLGLRADFFYGPNVYLGDASWREFVQAEQPEPAVQPEKVVQIAAKQTLSAFNHLRYWQSLRGTALSVIVKFEEEADLSPERAVDLARAVLANPMNLLARSLIEHDDAGMADEPGYVDVAFTLAENIIVLAEAADMILEKHRLRGRPERPGPSNSENG